MTGYTVVVVGMGREVQKRLGRSGMMVMKVAQIARALAPAAAADDVPTLAAPAPVPVAAESTSSAAPLGNASPHSQSLVQTGATFDPTLSDNIQRQRTRVAERQKLRVERLLYIGETS